MKEHYGYLCILQIAAATTTNIVRVFSNPDPSGEVGYLGHCHGPGTIHVIRLGELLSPHSFSGKQARLQTGS